MNLPWARSILWKRRPVPQPVWSSAPHGNQYTPEQERSANVHQTDNPRFRQRLFRLWYRPIPPHCRQNRKRAPRFPLLRRRNFPPVSAAARFREAPSPFRASESHRLDSVNIPPNNRAYFLRPASHTDPRTPFPSASARLGQSAWRATRHTPWLAQALRHLPDSLQCPAELCSVCRTPQIARGSFQSARLRFHCALRLPESAPLFPCSLPKSRVALRCEQFLSLATPPPVASRISTLRSLPARS